MRRVLENTDHLTIRQGEVSEILTESVLEKPGEGGSPEVEKAAEIRGAGFKKRVVGVKTNSGAVYHCRAVVLAQACICERSVFTAMW